MDGQTSEQGSQASASLKVTLEPHPEPRTRIFSQTGEEEFEHDETPEERFLKNLRHIDFSFHEEDEKSGAKQKAKQQAPANVWDNFAQSIGRAMGELSAMIEVIDKLREAQHLHSIEFTKLRSTDAAIISEITITASQKAKQLRRASNILESAAKRLRKSTEETDEFFKQLLQLRRRWRISGRATSVGTYEPTMFVNMSYSEDGAPSRQPALVPLRKDEGGNVCIDIVTKLESSILHVGQSCTRFLHLENTSNRTCAVGVEECHQYLLVLQQAVWNRLVFKQLIQDGVHLLEAGKPQKDAPSTSVTDATVGGPMYMQPQLGEKEIKFNTTPTMRTVNIQLVDREENVDTSGSDNADAMDVEGRGVQPREPLRAVERDYSSTDRELTLQTLLDTTLEVSIHTMAREQHLKRIENNHSLKLSTGKLQKAMERERSPVEKARVTATQGILPRSMLLAAHLQLLVVTTRIMAELTSNLSRSIAPFQVHWISTGKRCTSSFDITSPIGVYIPVTIEDTSIRISTTNVVYIPEQLGQYLLDKVAIHLLDLLHAQAAALFPDKLHQMRRQPSAFAIEFDDRKLEIHICPTKSWSIVVVARETPKVEESHVTRARKLDWYSGDPVTAIVNLLRGLS